MAESILVTGCAGFIGFHLSRLLLEQGRTVLGIDNLNGYYDPALKQARLDRLSACPGFTFARLDLADRAGVAAYFDRMRPRDVVHLAAQAGVRYSFANPLAYVDANLVGFAHVLEGCRAVGSRHLVFASTSSVYGANTKVPFSVHDNVDHPLSFYAATKKANELMAHTYAHLYGLPVTGLRFFTVYGPWGRPDMALFLFTRAILAGQPITVFNEGEMWRDFTYVDDVVAAVARLIGHLPAPDPDWRGDRPDPAASRAPYRLYNIGNHAPVKLTRLIEVLEQALGRPARKVFAPMPPGDVPRTFADVDELVRAVDFRPDTPIEQGVARFVEWYRDYYGT